jgi:hypothetical protein
MEIIIKIFVYFVFFKVFYTFAFDRSFPLVTSAMVVGCAMLLDFGVAAISQKMYIDAKATEAGIRNSSIHWRTRCWITYAAAIVPGILFGILIVYGFSHEFFQREMAPRGYGLFDRYSGFVTFGVGFIIPTFFSFLFLLWAFGAHERSFRR